MAENTERLKQGYAAFSQGDVQTAKAGNYSLNLTTKVFERDPATTDTKPGVKVEPGGTFGAAQRADMANQDRLIGAAA